MAKYVIEFTEKEINILIVAILLKLEHQKDILKKPKSEDSLKFNREKLTEVDSLLDKLRKCL